MTPRWAEHVYALRYQIGDRTLFSRALRLLATQMSLEEGIAQRGTPRAPVETLPQGYDGFMMRCVPHSGVEGDLRSEGGYLEYVLSRHPRYYVELFGSFEDYVRDRFSPKTRATMQRKVKRFADRCGGGVSWTAYRTGAELRRFHPLARQVSAETYQERLFDAGLPGDRAFIEQMCREGDADRVRAFLLFDTEKPVAFLYLRAEGQALVYSYVGFLPSYRQWSVGTILQWLALEHLFSEQRFRLFDFTEGGGEHKRFFATQHLDCANVMLLRRTLQNRLLIVGHRATNGFSRRAGRTLARVGLRAGVKRFIRYGLPGLRQKSA